MQILVVVEIWRAETRGDELDHDRTAIMVKSALNLTFRLER